MSTDTLNNDDFTDSGYDSLFGGEKLISLFDKTHDVGTSRTGIITKAPETRQSRFFADEGIGALKFWGEDGVPTEDTRSADGRPLKPCMDEVFVLQTDYVASPSKLEALGLEEDSGLRGVFASGDQLKAIRQAIRDAKVKNRDALVGMTLALTRTGKAPAGKYKKWTWKATLAGTPAAPKPVSDPFADADA